jgi:hypothetical protein
VDEWSALDLVCWVICTELPWSLTFEDLDVSVLRVNTIVAELGLLPDGCHSHHGLADRCWSDRYEAVLWCQHVRSLGGDAAPKRAIVSGTWWGLGIHIVIRGCTWVDVG